MFTGIVEEVGAVLGMERGGRVARLAVGAALTREGVEPGGSVAVSGVCLTVVERRPDGFVFELGPETLARTTLGGLEAGDRINLETDIIARYVEQLTSAQSEPAPRGSNP